MTTDTGSNDTSAQGNGTTDTGDGENVDWKAKFEEAQKHSRTWEQRAKDNKSAADELATLKDSKKTVEQKLADLEAKHAEAEARALRSDIATKHGISAEDRDLFLTGSDEATLTAQAKRLAERIADQKKNGNRAPKEGRAVTTTISPKDAAKREWLASLTGDNA
ncbi:hypothetical protein F6X37_32320 [Paraburkholderia sp. 31.1]|uniref:hypothetical protein n=1 Tax=Paraburkholderia sp. 31.1 TaxID=2615205 RepID=UPI001656519D|nr:hypothetical protein [Paraburkholderia sp. 31.1]MBC8726054.1 hypothetical protein [Paraburkholderia sp. 31.1]